MGYEVALADGTPVLLRPIEPGDKDILRRGFAALSPTSRYRRFFHNIDHLSDRALSYLTEVDGRDHVAWVAATIEDDPRPIGVGRWVRLAAAPDQAEAAITVVDAFHGQGIGKTLLHVLAHDAIERGVHAFKAWVIGGNDPIIKLLTDLGAELGRWESGVMELTVPLPETIEELERTPAPLILREVASGRLEAQAPGPGRAAAVLRRSADQAVVEEDPRSSHERGVLRAQDQGAE